MISVVISTRNEARNLPRCLACVRGMPEVIVVDSGSTDGTVEIAETAGVRVVRFEWNGRFPKKRNWVLLNVPLANPWVLFLDADEFPSAAFLEEAKAAVRNTTHAGFWLRYENWFLGRRLRHGDVLEKLALIRLGAGLYERIDEEAWSRLDMEVHEHPILEGTTGWLRTPIEHNDFKGLHAYAAKHNDYST